MYCFKKIIYIFFVILAVRPLLDAREITLMECINIALQNHSGLRILEEERKKAIADYKLAKSGSDPSIAFGINTADSNPSAEGDTFKIPGLDTDIKVFMGMTINYKLYDARQSIGEQAARMQIDYSKLSSLTKKGQMINDVKKMYYNLIIAQNNVLLNEKRHENSVLKLRESEILFKIGSISLQDITESKIAAYRTELQLERARTNERMQKHNLFLAMGIQSSQIDDFTCVLDEKLPGTMMNLDMLTKIAYENNPLLQEMKQKLKAGKMAIEYARALHQPNSALAVGIGSANSRIYQNRSLYAEELINLESWEPSIHFKITFNVPLYSGGAIDSRVESAISDYNIAVYREQDLKKQIEQQIMAYYTNINEYRKQLEIFDLLKENSEKQLLLAKKNYESGKISLAALNKIEYDILSDDFDSLRLKVDYLKALADFSMAVGVDEDYICGKNSGTK